jgi:alpha-tubulin suppressor-like RCC1 family protein
MSIQLMPSRSPAQPTWRRAWAAALLAVLCVPSLQGCLHSDGSDEPSINQQPRDRAGFVGSSVNFDIGVGGKGPLLFQWRRNGVAIAGATGAVFATPALTLADNGARYSVVVSNSAGSVTSAEAALAVFGPPTITTQPVAQTVAVGATATFTVAATGEGLGYQWRRNGIAVAGANTTSYTTTATVAADDGVEVSVDVVNGAGIAGSTPVLLTVTSSPALLTGPLSQRVAIGEQATFAVVATGGNLQYQWLRDGVPIAGATARSYVTPAVTAGDDGARFGVTITNAQGSATSGNATLTAVAAAIAAPTTPFAEVAASRSATAAESFTVVRRSNGSVSAWGYNADGQRGDGTNGTASDTPATVTLPAGVTARSVAAGGNHALLLGSNGEVYAWGRNASGQLGLGDQASRTVPSRVVLPAAAVSIAAGREFSVAALADGRVYAWGLNNDGQLGDGSRFSSVIPVEVTGLGGVTAVAAGNAHVLALRNDGSVWAWGANASGQLGIGGFALRRAPVATAARDAVRIRAGGDVSLAITRRRTGLAWGENGNGQLGLASLTTNDVPSPVGVLSGVVDGSAADTLSLFVGADGVLRAAGSNEAGSLGDGTTTARGSYAAVNAVAAAIGAAVGGRSFGVAVRSDGRLLSWGDNTGDQLGNPSLAATGTSTPTEVPSFSAGP